MADRARSTHPLLALTLAILATAALATGALADAPWSPLESADADLRSLAPIALDEALREARRVSADRSEPVWMVYRVESQPGLGSVCCYASPCCDLDHDDGFVHDPRIPVADDPILVLVRLERGVVRRLRAWGEGCRLGFGGRTVLWAGDIAVDESLATLDRWLAAGAATGGSDGDERHLADDTLAVIAHHHGEAATERLARVASTSPSEDLARDAAFWLGVARGLPGYEHLVELLSRRPELDVRKGIVFAIGQSGEPEASRHLVTMAQGDEEPELRREALFWLGQKGEAFGDMVFDAALADPDPEVARHAVFVLSQLPEPGNVERLSRVLAQNERPELRKEALFWIGQSDDPEALDIVTRILNQ